MEGEHTAYKEKPSPEKRIKLLTILVGLTLFLSLLTFASNIAISSKLSDGIAAAPTTAPSGGARPTPTGAVAAGPPTDVSADDDPSKGDANAPITIIEFSDFECPFCARFYQQTLPQLEKEYIDTGKVKFVYRDFPLSFHPNAQKAAEAGECADDQGKFWEMHDKIFDNQNAISINDLKGYAADLGLDTDEFNSCLDSGKHSAEVQKDFKDGQAARVSGTPAFFINGVKLVGAQPFSAFQQIIESQL